MNELDNIRSVVARFFNVAKSEVAETFVFPAERLQGSVARATLQAALNDIVLALKKQAEVKIFEDNLNW